MDPDPPGQPRLDRQLPTGWTKEQLLTDVWWALKNATEDRLAEVQGRVSPERLAELKQSWTHYMAGAFLTFLFAFVEDLAEKEQQAVWATLEFQHDLAPGEREVLWQLRNAVAHNGNDLGANRHKDAAEIVARFRVGLDNGSIQVADWNGKLSSLEPYFELDGTHVLLGEQLFSRAYQLVHRFCEEAGWSVNNPLEQGGLVG